VERHFKEALSYAVSLLSRRDYSLKALLKKVKEKFPEITEEEISLLKEELLKNRFINERNAIYNYFLSRMERGWGKRKIRHNLKRLGFDESLIDEVFVSVPYDYSFIVEEVKRKYPLRRRTEVERAKRFLLQRGFSFGEAQEIIRMAKD